MSGRRDHARHAQLRRRSGEVRRVQRVHRAVPDRRDRQLAAGRAHGRVHDRSPARVGHAAAAAGRGGRGVARHPAGGRASHRRRDGGTGRRGGAAVVGRASVRQPAHAREARRRHGFRQFPAHGRRRVERHPAHRPRLRLDGVPGARGADDRDRAAGRRRAGPPAFRAALLGRKPARRRAPALQQRRAHREARARGPRRPAGARRRVELPVRPREGRDRQRRRPVRHELPDAQPPGRRASS